MTLEDTEEWFVEQRGVDGVWRTSPKLNVAFAATNLSPGVNNSRTQTLVITLPVIVLQEFTDHFTKVPFASRYHPAHSFAFEREYESPS